MKLFYQYMEFFFNFQTTSNHLHPLQVENCDSNSRLVVDEDDNGKFRPERVTDQDYLRPVDVFIHRKVECERRPSNQSDLPADTRHITNVDLLLVHRLRRWPNIKTTLVMQCREKQKTYTLQYRETAVTAYLKSYIYCFSPISMIA